MYRQLEIFYYWVHKYLLNLYWCNYGNAGTSGRAV
jgi:hypothetical protein